MGSHWLRAVTESSVVRACGSVTNLRRIAASMCEVWNVKTQGNWGYGMFKGSIG